MSDCARVRRPVTLCARSPSRMNGTPMRSRAITRSLAAGAVLAAALGAGADRASAATTARVSSGILEITGDAGPNEIAIEADPQNVIVDVGGDGTADFTADRSTFTAIRVQGGGGADDLLATS